MKILTKDGKYQKVSNDWIAHDKVTKLGWKYSSRAEWKKNIRDSRKIEKELIDALAKKGKEAIAEVLSKPKKNKNSRWI